MEFKKTYDQKVPLELMLEEFPSKSPAPWGRGLPMEAFLSKEGFLVPASPTPARCDGLSLFSAAPWVGCSLFWLLLIGGLRLRDFCQARDPE